MIVAHIKKGNELEMIDFSELLQTRRSIRQFEDKVVPLDTIREIIEESCLAPSAANKQPWKFIVVSNKDLIKRLSDESKKNILALIEQSPDTANKKYEAAMRNPDFNVFYNAPNLIYIIGPKLERNLYVDCTLAACYFMFCATARGLGTCWIGLGTSILDPELLDLMGIPKDHEIVAPLILGYPKNIPDIPKRNQPQILKILD